jgi:transcriptional regulator with XRE-family HTH domain
MKPGVPEMSDWRNRLKNLLGMQRISARALARSAGLSTSTVHDMLNKEGFSPQINSLEKVFETLGARIEVVDGSQQHVHEWVRKRGFLDLTFAELDQLDSFCESIGTRTALTLLDSKVKTTKDLRKILNALSDLD